MFGKCKRAGFTLIEILAVLVILGLLAAIVPPLLRQARPAAEREKFITRLNAMMKFVWNNAIATGKIHRVNFDFKKKRVQAFIGGPKQQNPVPVRRTYFDPFFEIPKQLEVKNFYIEGKDEMTRYGPGKTSEETWFFVFPQGLSQEVVINMIDTKDKVNGRRNRPVGLVLNPFSVQFEEYNVFKKP